MTEVKINSLKGYELCDGYTIDRKGNLRSYKTRTRSMDGKIKSPKIDFECEPKILKGSIDSSGYPYYDLVKMDGKRTCPKKHRLLCLAFLKNGENKPEINHIDGIKTNNFLDNLEWVTRAENVQHSFDKKLNKPSEYSKGERNYQWDSNHSNCKKVRQMDLKGKEIFVHNSIAMASRSLNMKSQSGIAMVCNGNGKTAYGYKWEFVE